MKKEEKAKAIELRKQGFSLRTISKQLGACRSSVSYWVRNVLLTDAQKTQLIANKNNSGYLGFGARVVAAKSKEKRMEYQNIGIEKASNCDIEYSMGCMLYWAEGSKNKNAVIFTNTDVDMMVFFVNFMRKYFNCNNEDFAVSINTYLDNGYTEIEVENFWMEKFKLDRTCLRKSIFRKGDGTGKYPYGTCRISIGSTKIVQQIYGSIQKLIGFKRELWLNGSRGWKGQNKNLESIK